MPTPADQIRKAILGRSPVVYLASPEEERLVKLLRIVAEDTGGDTWPVYTWTCVSGFDGPNTERETHDPVAALQAVTESGGRGFFVMKDMTDHFGRVDVIRALRDFYYASRGNTEQFVFLLAPDVLIPESLKREVHVMTVPPPGDDEILAELKRVQAMHPELVLPQEYQDDTVLALKGLTLDEISHILHRVFEGGSTDRNEIMNEIHGEKEMAVRRTGYLEFCPPRWSIDRVGGLGALKKWLDSRRNVFGQEALEAGVPMPKGVLIMGVSGCGKSLAVKVVSSHWNVPLFRLDMNAVFSGIYGSPEAAFQKALETIESVAPAVLWIDEIENSLGLEEDRLTIASHIFSTFLTWMQEKPPLVFIAATANRIHALPAEIIRKGRFDQVFFVDLPNDQERKEIIEIHLRNNDADPESFDLKLLTVMTKGWNGAEIEQAVISARTNAYAAGRPFVMRDLSGTTATIVPLSKTMDEQIKGIRAWAFDRATPASQFSRVRR